MYNKIYPVLRKLESRDYIKKEVVFQTGKPNKHLYSWTQSGKEHFFEKIKEPSELTDMDNPFFVKSFFFRFLDKKDVAAEFEKEIQSVDETISNLVNLKNTVESQADKNGQFIYRTTILLLETMEKTCLDELSRIKRKNR